MRQADNRQTIKYFVALILLLAIGFQPVVAFAQLITTVPVGHPGLGSGGVVGEGAAAVADAALVALDVKFSVCKTEENIAKGLDVADTSFGGLSLVAGNKEEIANLTTRIKTMEALIVCYQVLLASIKAVPTPNLFLGQKKQRLEAETILSIETLKSRKDQLQARLRIAKTGFWKGILAGILIKTTKVVAERLVYSLTSRYKINDVMQYADAVASQVYSAQLIHDLAADNEEQLILRSFATNPLLRTKIDSAIYQRAADAVQLNGDVFSARTFSADDPDFYLKLAKFGDPETSVPYLKTAYEGRANQIQTVGLASANNEMLLGSGLKAPRTCAGNVNEQIGIEQKWVQVSDEYRDREKLLRDLQGSHISLYANKQLNPKEAKQLEADIAKAQRDFDQAAIKLKAMPKSFESADGQKSKVFKACEAIASPAEMVNKGIDEAFKSIGKGLGDYNDNNLPFFMSWISDVGANIGSSLIFGGNVKASFLAESGQISTAINTALSFADARVSKNNLENGLKFDYNVSASGAGRYTLHWEILDVDNASFVTIEGPGISNFKLGPSGGLALDPATGLPVYNELGLIGDLIVSAPQGGSYVLRVYNSKKQRLSNTGTLTIPRPTTNSSPATTSLPSPVFIPGPGYSQCIADGWGEAYCQGTHGSVRGAFVRKLSEPPRGYKTEELR